MTEMIDWARVPYAELRRPQTQRFLTRWLRLHERAGHRVSRHLSGEDALFEAFGPPDGMRRLSVGSLQYPDITTQFMAATRQGTGRPWRSATVAEALGVPAIFRAASLIANTTGSLSMRALRNEIELDPSERPRLIVRPDPARTPREFYRDSAWNLARYGEAWWWVSKRTEGQPASLYNVPDPREVQVEATTDPLRPAITWRNRSTRDGTLRHEDMRQITFLTDDLGLRGIGPLQVCGAAVSVSVEAQEWAANFYAAGGYPNIWIKAAGELGGGSDDAILDEDDDAAGYSEAERLKAQWISTAPNTPKVTDESILDIKQFDPNPGGAQMLEARDHQNGDAARMFGMPGSLLDYRSTGSNLTYQNIEQEFQKWLRSGLRIGYLEPIEQAMSDLLTRSTVSRFNTEPIEAPDVKTRFEVYALATQVLGPEEGSAYARRREGLAPGNVENAPVPFVPPVPVPARAASTAMRDVRCPRCHRLIVRAAGPIEGYCRYCKETVAA